MKFKALLDAWSQAGTTPKTAREYSIRLPLDAAARLHALAELFPGRTLEQIITDLLSSGLQEIEAAMPYKPGTKVISQDEQGDPIYEDVGPTPRFEMLVRKFKNELAAETTHSK